MTSKRYAFYEHSLLLKGINAPPNMIVSLALLTRARLVQSDPERTLYRLTKFIQRRW